MAGKPRDGKPRDVRVELRVLPEEHEAWSAAAKRDERALSAWVRKVANDAARVAPAKPKAKR